MSANTIYERVHNAVHKAIVEGETRWHPKDAVDLAVRQAAEEIRRLARDRPREQPP